jgi:DNA-binding SARP family transcriptional activator/tetratricopeptide (TPR) repeat protein
MEFLLLGPLEVRRDGSAVPVPGAKQRAVLAALLLAEGQAVSIDQLADSVWGTAPPPSARVTIQNYVARLRRVVGETLIETRPDGYLLRVGPGQLDLSRFRDLLSTARAAAQDQSWAAAAASARAAVSLWRGEPLGGVGSEVLAAREAPVLAELRLQALEVRMEAELRLGAHQEVLADARRLVQAHPLRERPHALLMRALYRDGRQAEALQAYQQTRAVLIEELGTEPGPELQRLHQQILAADPALSDPALFDAAPSGAAVRPAGDARYSLPPDVAFLTGREPELDHLTAAAARTAAADGPVLVCAIGGMPGIGKTALAVHAAHRLAARFPGGQFFIDLHAHTPGQEPLAPEAVLAGLLAAAGLDPRYLPGDLAGRAGLWRGKTAGRQILLVLDNAASSAQVAPLLPGAGGLVLVTSRRQLGDLPGTVGPVLLETLPPDAAREMFTELAPRVATESAALVTELSELAGFLPLAISLLARVHRRHPAWSLADLAAETRASLLTLTAERDSVAAAFTVSYQYLDPGLRTFFRSLGLHPGTTVDAHAAAELADIARPAAARMLDTLHGEGLLTETSYRRYGLHDLIRRYARDLATADPGRDRDAALGRLLGYYARAAGQAQARLDPAPELDPAPAGPPGQPDLPDLSDRTRALAWLRTERHNLIASLDAAAAAGRLAHVTALTAAIARLLRMDGPWAEAVARHDAAAQAAHQRGDRPAQAAALYELGMMQSATGDVPAATRAMEESLRIFADLGIRSGQASALNRLGHLHQMAGDYPAANCSQQEALAVARVLGDRLRQARVLHDLGIVCLVTGDFTGATRAQQEALAIFRDLGDQTGQANALSELGSMHNLAGNGPEAARVLVGALEIYREIGDRMGQANTRTYLGVARRLAGDYAGAAQVLAGALADCRNLGYRLGEANALNFLGVVRRLTGDYQAAARALAAALEIYRGLGDRGGEVEALNGHGDLDLARGDPDQASTWHGQALDLAREIGSAQDEACALAGLGRCAQAAGDTAAARARLGQAHAIFARIGVAEAQGTKAELEALTDRLRGDADPCSGAPAVTPPGRPAPASG